MQIIDYRHSVWPSNVPRNFATEAETWRDLGVLQQQIGDNDDASFFIDFEWNYDGAPPTTANILTSTGTGVRFGVYASVSGAVTVHSNILGAVNSYVYKEVRSAGNPLSRGRHVIRARVIDTTLYAQLDSEPEVSTTGARVGNKTPAAPISNANMSIYSVWVRNDTTGKIIWSYPSYSERTRLVTLSNVLTSNNVFEGAMASVVRRVKTALDLRGNSTSKTFVCGCYIPSHAPDGKLYVSGLITQGNYISGSATQEVFELSVWEDYRSSSTKRLFAQIGQSTSVKGPTIDLALLNVFDRWVTLGVVVDYANNTVGVYVDGVLAGYSNVVLEPFGQGASSPFSDTLSIMHDITTSYISDYKIAWAGVWNKAMSQNEIKAFNEYQYWTVPVSAGSLNIQATGFPNLQWTLPDGTKSTTDTINQSVTTGNVICKYTGGLSSTSQLRINAATIQSGAVLRASELPRVKLVLVITTVTGFSGAASELPRVSGQLQLYTLDGLTGNVIDLPRVTQNLYLLGLPNITGTTADLPRVTLDLYLVNIPNLSGTTSDLPRVTNYLNITLPLLTGSTGELPSTTSATRFVINCPGITGALSVVSTNTQIRFYKNAKVTPAEYDQTIQNIVNAGGTNGALYISSNKTSASDANIATLQSRGWTVNVITDPPYVP